MEIELGHNNAIDTSVLMGAHNRYIRMPWGKFDANTNVTIVTNFTNQNMIPNKDSNYK